MLPEYILLGFPDETIVLGCNEWSDMLPRYSGIVRIKPLYSNIEVEEAPQQKQIGGCWLSELKRTIRDGQIVGRSEHELRNPFASLAIEDGISNLHDLLSVPESGILCVWKSIPWSERKLTLSCELVQTVSQLLDQFPKHLLGSSQEKAWIIGSLAYMPEISSARDIDISLVLCPHEALELRSWVAELRMEKPEYRPEYEPFMFPFKLRIEESSVDLFPCIGAADAGDAWHPLKDARSWRVKELPRYRKARVLDVSLSCYAYPVLIVEGDPIYLVVGSNAFRGAFVPGDIIECFSQRLTVFTTEGANSVDFIADPWKNMLEWGRFVDLERDEKWMRPK